MAKIKTSKGNTILVSISDLDQVEKHVWHERDRSRPGKPSDKFPEIYTVIDNQNVTLARFLLNEAGSGQREINNNFMRNNLTKYPQRYAKPTNALNLKGVTATKTGYNAHITLDGEKLFLGVFDDAKDAALEYNDAVDYYWNGEGYKNFKN